MTITARRRVLIATIFGIPLTLFFGVLLFELAHPSLPPVAPLPDSNGYNDLIHASALLSKDDNNYETAGIAQLRDIVAANSNALALARAGLSNECQVPLQFTQAYNESHLNDLADTKRLARAFVAEGKLTELENHPTVAARSYLDVIHLGIESCRGGVVIDQLVGTAIEAIGRSALQKLVDKLDAKSARQAAAILEVLDARRQTWAEVRHQENDWSRTTFTGIRYELMRLMTHKSTEKLYVKAAEKMEQQELKTRQLIVELAARAYLLETGHAPASLSDLTPDYLKSIPQDPFTGTNLVYFP